MRIWRPYDDATAHFRAALVLSMRKVRAVGRLSMRSHSVHWRCQCVVVVMLAVVLRAPRRSVFSWTPLDRRENTALYDLGLSKLFSVKLYIFSYQLK